MHLKEQKIDPAFLDPKVYTRTIPKAVYLKGEDEFKNKISTMCSDRGVLEPEAKEILKGIISEFYKDSPNSNLEVAWSSEAFAASLPSVRN